MANYKVMYFAALLFLIWSGAPNHVGGIPGMRNEGRKSLEKALTPTRKATTVSCYGDCDYLAPDCENPDYCQCDTDDEVCIPKDFSCSGDCTHLAPDCYNEEYCECDEENEVCIPRN